MVILELDPRTDPRWDRYVASHPDALVYHHPAFLRALGAAYHLPVLGLACVDEQGSVQGILPLVNRRGLITGRRLVSLPQTPMTGPLANDDGALHALLAHAMQHARALGGTRLEVRLASEPPEEAIPGLQAEQWSVTYARSLPADPGALRFGNSRNHARVRWKVSRAERNGVEVRPAEDEATLRAWYQLYLETMRAHVVPPRPYRFFAALWRELHPLGMCRLLVAERVEGGARRLIAGSVFLLGGSTVLYAYNGRSAADLPLRPNDLIQWRSLHDAVDAGYRRYDFGEVAESQAGLAAFKSTWGAEVTPLYRLVGVAGAAQGHKVLERPGDRGRQIAEALWRRVPLPVTAPLGGFVHRRL